MYSNRGGVRVEAIEKMNSLPFLGISEMRLDRDGTMSVLFADGRRETATLGRAAFEPSSAMASSTYLPQPSQLRLETVRGDEMLIDIPLPDVLAPLDGRVVIYLDQNHWSTLTHAIHEPGRVPDERELSAALKLVELVESRQVVLPMSSGHMSETCKQVDFEQRYRRALTIVKLSGGWQLRDPLDVRRFEIRQALTIRYRRRCLLRSAVVTLEPDAVHAGRGKDLPTGGSDRPARFRWLIHAISCIGGNVDAMLDSDYAPMLPPSRWVAEFQNFATFLQGNQVGKELKRRRTYAKFIADLGSELANGASLAGASVDELTDWTLNCGEEDLKSMPALGLYREVIHEKLSDGRLRWEENDLTDMMYLTAAAGYCDHVVGERKHAAHIANALRRLGQAGRIHRNIRSLVEFLEA